MRLPIATQSAKGRSVQLSAEMLVNMYAEAAPSGAKSSVVALGCPGLSTFAEVGQGRIRGLHRMMSDSNTIYAVVGNRLHAIHRDGSSVQLGTVAYSGRVSMADNGEQLCIVAGRRSYIYDGVNGLRAIDDPNFPAAESVTYMDGYFVFNNRVRGQREQFFISALRDGAVYDATDFASAERYPDDLVRVFSDHAELLLFGSDSIEIWFNAGHADFPFARAQGSVIEQGLGAKWSVEKLDESVLWLDNEGMVRRLEGVTPIRISTHAIEYQIAQGDWRNAYAWAYADEGHQFYVLTVPASEKDQEAGTYVYDAATQLWHSRKSYDLDMFRGAFYVNAFGKHLVGDYRRGALYEMSLDIYQDANDPLVSELIFPQIQNDGQRFIVHDFQLDAEVGMADITTITRPMLTYWEQENSGVATPLNDVAMDGDTAVAVGEGGIILKSTDNGGSWALKPSGFGTDHISAIACGDGKWAGVGSGAKWAVSDDGGETWAADSKTFGVTQQSQTAAGPYPFGIAFKPDGTKAYIAQMTENVVRQYTVSAAWDTSTLSYDSVSLSLTGACSIAFNSDGTKAYLLSNNTRLIYQHSLSAVWDLSSATYDGVAFDVGSQESTPYDMFFKPDGTKFYVSGSIQGTIFQYVMSTAWDLSTASYDSASYKPDWPVRGITLSDRGDKLFMCSTQTDQIYQFTLSDPWLISSANYDGISFPVVRDTQSLVFSPDGSKLFTTETVNNYVTEYEVLPPYSLSPATIGFNDIAYAEGAWVIGCDSGVILATEDLVNLQFQANSFGSSAVYAVAFADGKWLAAGGDGAMEQLIDGTAWAAVPSSFGLSAIRGLAFGNGIWVAVGDSGKIATSVDGMNWTQSSNPFDSTHRINSITFNDGLWVAGSASGEIGYSLDGKEWALIDSSFDSTPITGIAFSGNNGIAVGHAGKIATTTTATETVTTSVNDPQVMLDVSSDNMRTMTQPWRSLGKKGEYSQRIIWRRLGQHRSFTPKVSISDPVRRAVFTAYAKIQPCE